MSWKLTFYKENDPDLQKAKRANSWAEFTAGQSPEASSSGKQANKLGEWQAGGGVLGETQIWEVGGIRAGRTLKHLSVRLL